MDYVQMKSNIWDINDDTGLTAFIAELDRCDSLTHKRIHDEAEAS